MTAKEKREANASQEIKCITLALPFRLGSVNCYLVQSGAGYLLVDTGSSNARAELLEALESAGCAPGSLGLVALTHGDFDHTGSAAYLREAFGPKIAMHPDDAGMAERGDMFWNRGRPNALMSLIGALINRAAPVLFGFGRSERFKPDVWIEDGYDLSEYGFDAQVISLPGHSKGSVGILTRKGDLFCGDLLENTERPKLNSIMDDVSAAQASVAKLKTTCAKTIYPGHGSPFPVGQLEENI